MFFCFYHRFLSILSFSPSKYSFFTTACLFVDVSTTRPLCDVSRLLHHLLLTHFFPKHRRTIAVPDTDPYGTWQICHKDVNITLGEIVGRIIAELPSGMKKVGLALLIGCHIRAVKKSLDVSETARWCGQS